MNSYLLINEQKNIDMKSLAVRKDRYIFDRSSTATQHREFQYTYLCCEVECGFISCSDDPPLPPLKLNGSYRLLTPESLS